MLSPSCRIVARDHSGTGDQKSPRSSIEAFSLRVEEAWWHQARAEAVAEMLELDRAALRPAFDQADGDGMAEMRARIAAGHVAEAALAARDTLDRMRADGDRRGAVDPDADQPLAIRLVGRRREQRAVADIGVLPLVSRSGHAEIVRHGLAVGVLADVEVALLRAQHAERLDAERNRAGLPCPLPQRRAKPRRHRDLVAALAREAHPRHPRGPPAEARIANAHVREPGVVQLHAEPQPADDGLRMRAGDRDGGPMRGRVVDENLIEVEAVLPPRLQCRDHAGDVRAGAGDDEMRRP